MRPTRLFRALAPWALIALPAGAAARQFVTDDAEIVERGACQVEAWYSRPASWILPACQLIPRVEITVGAGAIESDGGHELRYVVQAKTLLRPLDEDGVGLGLAAGFGLDPLGQIVARRIDAVYTYVPLSVAVYDGRLVLHQNAGWIYGPEPLEGPGPARCRHALTWGMRLDGALTPRVAVIAEVFGQSRVFPEYQVGLRLSLVPDRLLADVSYGAPTAGDAPGALTIGLAWSPLPWRSFSRQCGSRLDSSRPKAALE